MQERTGKCDDCGETRYEMGYPRFQMTVYLCPGCGTIRVVDNRGELPDDVDQLPRPFIDYLRTQIAA